MVETNTIQLWKEVKSTKRELGNGRHRLKVVENVCTSMEHDRSIVEEARHMAEC